MALNDYRRGRETCFPAAFASATIPITNIRIKNTNEPSATSGNRAVCVSRDLARIDRG